MKRLSIRLILILFILVNVYASNINRIENFLNNIGDIKIIGKTFVRVEGEKVAQKYYFSDGGTIIFNEDEILFFSLKRGIPYNNIIKKYLKSIDGRKNKKSSKLLDLHITNNILPLTETEWGICPPFNDKMPIISGTRAYASHIGVAIAQLMKYWKHPRQGKGSYAYELRELSLKANFNHIYDYDNMPNILKPYSPEKEKDNVSQLIYDTSIAVRTDFYNFSKAENSRIIPALKEYFGFSSDMRIINRVNYDDSQWFDIIKRELKNKRIILYNLRGNTKYDHMAIVDGYIETGSEKLIHINLGCGGKMSGYYSFNAVWKFTDNNAQFMIININPAPSIPIPKIIKKFSFKKSYLLYENTFDYIEWNIENNSDTEYFFNIYKFDFVKKIYTLLSTTSRNFILINAPYNGKRKYIIKTIAKNSESLPSEEIVFD